MQAAILIILFLFILFFLLISFIIFKNNIKKLKDDNLVLRKKNEELTNTNLILQENLSFSNIKLQNIYEELGDNINKNIENINSSHNLVFHQYSEFLIRLKDEIERKKRYSFLSFCVLQVSIDFFDEYIKIYGNGIDSFLNDFKLDILNTIRNIDFFSESKTKNTIYGLLPITELDGAAILAKRMQALSKEISVDKIVTLTISIIQPEENFDISDILKNLRNMSESSESSGGNIIKLENI